MLRAEVRGPEPEQEGSVSLWEGLICGCWVEEGLCCREREGGRGSLLRTQQAPVTPSFTPPPGQPEGHYYGTSPMRGATELLMVVVFFFLLYWQYLLKKIIIVEEKFKSIVRLQ